MKNKKRILLLWLEENNSHNTRLFMLEVSEEESKKYLVMANQLFRYSNFDQDEEPQEGTDKHTKWKLWSLLQWCTDAEREAHGITEFEEKVVLANKLQIDYIIKMHKVDA